MQLRGIDTEKCEQRNRIAARREDVEGVPVRFLATSEPDFAADEIAGEMPDTITGALAAINARLPEGAASLGPDDVYVHFIEAANDSFIGDRYMFLGESTLRNIAVDAAAGFAFMNSHHTGSISTPSELPFGKTFAGQYQSGVDADGKRHKRAMVGFYMLRGIRPNGEAGPTTDDLHAMIAGGQVADVSVGLTAGDARCDVCAGDLRAAGCAHAPGTRRGMTDGEIEAQGARGIPGGRASYTLEDARCGEVSAVFNGAVPGAGIKKVLSLRQRGRLNHREWKEARAAFGSLLNRDAAVDQDLFDQVAEAVESGVRSALGASPVGLDEPAPVVAETTESVARDLRAALLQAQAEGDADLAPRREPEDEPVTGPEESTEEGETTMADENDLTLAGDVAALRAELAAAQLAQSEQAAQLAALKERNARLEHDSRNARFTAEIEGTARGGVRWFGDADKHRTMLHALSTAFGEDSPEVSIYIEQNRAYAAQSSDSAFLREFGSDNAGEPVPAIDELQTAATRIQADNPRLTPAQAFAHATETNPALYDRYLSEMRGSKGRK